VEEEAKSLPALEAVVKPQPLVKEERGHNGDELPHDGMGVYACNVYNNIFSFVLLPTSPRTA